MPFTISNSVVMVSLARGWAGSAREVDAILTGREEAGRRYVELVGKPNSQQEVAHVFASKLQVGPDRRGGDSVVSSGCVSHLAQKAAGVAVPGLGADVLLEIANGCDSAGAAQSGLHFVKKRRRLREGGRTQTTPRDRQPGLSLGENHVII